MSFLDVNSYKRVEGSGLRGVRLLVLKRLEV